MRHRGMDDERPFQPEPPDPRDLARIAEGRKRRSIPRPMADIAGPLIASVFRRQGFASTEIVTRWAEIAGPDIAALAEPVKMVWPPDQGERIPEPATLILRCAGPESVEVQHMSATILERVNQSLGWRAVAKLRIQQGPLQRAAPRPRLKPADPAALARAEARLGAVADDGLRQALARLGAAVKPD
jgi:hypothetical protein